MALLRQIYVPKWHSAEFDRVKPRKDIGTMLSLDTVIRSFMCYIIIPVHIYSFTVYFEQGLNGTPSYYHFLIDTF